MWKSLKAIFFRNHRSQLHFEVMVSLNHGVSSLDIPSRRSIIHSVLAHLWSHINSMIYLKIWNNLIWNFSKLKPLSFKNHILGFSKNFKVAIFWVWLVIRSMLISIFRWLSTLILSACNAMRTNYWFWREVTVVYLGRGQFSRIMARQSRLSALRRDPSKWQETLR